MAVLLCSSRGEGEDLGPCEPQRRAEGGTVTSSLYVLIVKTSQADVHKKPCGDRVAFAFKYSKLAVLTERGEA